ncbi:MAG: hypothetical protein ACI399_05065 [Candidatus Cryptobacteroides sp.]
MKRFLMFAVAAVLLVQSCQNQSSDSFESLNRQAAEEYLVPIRPAYEGRNPAWNGYALKFLYAPSFDFQKMDGADHYKFTVKDTRSESVWSFEADSPDANLSPVWNDIHPADVHLTVEAVAADGTVLGVVGERDFLRDFPFNGPYPGKALPYRESALRAALYTHRMPAVQSWKTQTVPDLSYCLNAYPCKIIGATLSNEAFIATMIPAYKEEALQIARNAAKFLIDQSRPEGTPLEFFPPTFYLDEAQAGRADNKGWTMMMEPTKAGNGFLDLFNVTGDSLYLDRALKIADTYKKLQAEDGSLPVKVDFITGVPMNDAKITLEPLLMYIHRLETEFGVYDYAETKAKAEKWMEEVPMKAFDLEGSFEDTYSYGSGPYQNLTNCTSALYASYLLRKDSKPSAEDVENAVDLIRLCEDQFVHWDYLPDDETGVREIPTPSTFEQYRCYEPVDASSSNMADAYLDLYAVTGDRLLLEKARALMDHLTILQNQITGMIISIDEPVEYFWINCNFGSLSSLMRLADVVGE